MTAVGIRTRPNDFDVALGERVKRLRIARGMTQSDLGREIGVSYQQCNKYEKGRDRINVERLLKVADALSVEPWELIAVQSNGSAMTRAGCREGLEASELFLSLPHHQRRGVMKLMRCLASGGES